MYINKLIYSLPDILKIDKISFMCIPWYQNACINLLFEYQK